MPTINEKLPNPHGLARCWARQLPVSHHSGAEVARHRVPAEQLGGRKVPRWNVLRDAPGRVLEPGAFFEVADGQFDPGTVELVGLDERKLEVADERVVLPVRPESCISVQQKVSEGGLEPPRPCGH